LAPIGYVACAVFLASDYDGIIAGARLDIAGSVYFC
jgi:hypothetical protein